MDTTGTAVITMGRRGNEGGQQILGPQEPDFLADEFLWY